MMGRGTCAAGLMLVLGTAGMAGPLVVDAGIAQPLTDQPGDAVRGEALVRDMSRASCLICHQMPLEGEPDMGSIGPPLAGVGTRLPAPALRLRLVDARLADPDTVMPPYHALDGLVRVGAAYAGQTIYSAQEVEDVLAFLLTLTAP